MINEIDGIVYSINEDGYFCIYVEATQTFLSFLEGDETIVVGTSHSKEEAIESIKRYMGVA